MSLRLTKEIRDRVKMIDSCDLTHADAHVFPKGWLRQMRETFSKCHALAGRLEREGIETGCIRGDIDDD